MPLILSLFVLLFSVSSVQAEEVVYGMAMHGAPKYEVGFEKLDYVSDQAVKGGRFVRSAIGTFDTLNEFNIKGKKAEGLENLYDPLMRRVWDEPFSLYGLIAKEIIVPEDRSEITYILNPAAKFHDGTPITSEDVVFSFEQHKKHGKPVTRRVYSLVDHYEIISPQKIRFVLGEGYDAETVMILSIMRIVPKAYWQDKDFGATTLEPPLGSGPYKISAVDPGRRLVYERVKDYWAKDLPVNKYQYNFDEIVFDYYRDETVAFEALKTGNVDMWRENDIGRWVSAYKGLDSVKPVSFDHQRPEWLKAVIFNTRKDLFADLRVREALNLAFPYDWVNQTLFHNQLKVTQSVFANSELAASTQAAQKLPERQRLRKAVNLLKEAGWHVENGVLQKDGQDFTFEILLSNPDDEKIALSFVRSLEKLGIKANVRPVDSAQFLGRLNDYDYDMVFYRWINSLSPGNEQYVYWGSGSADQIGTRNYAGVKSDAVDMAINDMVNAKERGELVDAAHRLDIALMSGYYFIPLYYKGFDTVALSAAIAYPDMTPVYGPVTETWWHK
ncbi:MAG: ABC transporter substrate-binding protein [Micavibrio sp.]|nr:ABC transporter substrate-binding protein [Micavibrio sp.]HCK31975.1 ABC transporter substrate-binding protein [Rhodospirillaceae bacterium]